MTGFVFQGHICACACVRACVYEHKLKSCYLAMKLHTQYSWVSVVEHCVSIAKCHGFNSQGTYILEKMYNLNTKSLWIKAFAKCINVNIMQKSGIPLTCCNKSMACFSSTYSKQYITLLYYISSYPSLISLDSVCSAKKSLKQHALSPVLCNWSWWILWHQDMARRSTLDRDLSASLFLLPGLASQLKKNTLSSSSVLKIINYL